MLSVDSDRTGPRDNACIWLAWCEAVATFGKATFSSLKATLATKSDANYCWCDSY